MIALSSSSTTRPIDTARISPVPTERLDGSIFPSAPPSRPSSPSMRGTEKPQMSASSTPTTKPRAASDAARLTVTDDLPTPPLPEATASTRVVAGTSVVGAFSLAFHRARCITWLRCSALSSPKLITTSCTPSSPRIFDRASSRIWVRSGQPAMVSAITTSTVASGRTSIRSTMPSSTMSALSSGSMTPRRTCRTSSTEGRGVRPTGGSVDATCSPAWSGEVTPGMAAIVPAGVHFLSVRSM